MGGLGAFDANLGIEDNQFDNPPSGARIGGNMMVLPGSPCGLFQNMRI